MTDFTAIPDISVYPDAPVTSELMYALRDNLAATMEGAAGAPRLQFDALDPAFSTAGGVGSYVFARSTADRVFGATVAGSTLLPTSAAYSVTIGGGSTVTTLASGSALTGTWRCMGLFDLAGSGTGAALLGATLWMRIA